MVGIDDPTPSQLTEYIKETVSKSHFADNFPVLVEGWDESDIHSIGLSYYSLLGSTLGYTAFVDGMIFDRELRRLTDQDTRKSTAPIADSVWVDEGKYTTACAVEFQKLQSVSKIRKKSENMVRYDEICKNINTLVLHYWDTQRHDLPDNALTPFERGFTTEEGVAFESPDADVLVYKSEFSRSKNGDLVLDSVCLSHEY